jgi:predicted PurR-regulated permease PerM
MYKKLYLTLLAALATAGAIVLFAMLAAPVAKPFILALIIGISTMPHYNRLLKWVHGRASRASGLMVLAITICIILPLVALVVSATMSANEWYQQVQQLILSISKTGAGTLSHFPLLGKASALAQRFGMDIRGMGAKAASAGSALLLDMAGGAAKNLLDFLFTLALALFLLFFIYRDGERIVANCIGRMAANKERANRYVSQIRSITTAVTVGTIFTCATQGVTAGLGYWVAGVPAPVFCGALTAIAALVPVVGTGVIWVPLTIFVALNGAYLTAILLAAWCMVFVGLADNAIRPLAIGAASDIPVVAIVLGAICGVVSMGMLGLILGPVIFAILMSLWGEVVSDANPDTPDAPDNNAPEGGQAK